MGATKRIVLANPYEDSQPYCLPNLGMGYLTTALERAGHEVVYVDGVKEGLTPAAWKALLRRHEPDVVGVQMFTYAFHTVREMMALAKDTLPGVVTVVGGPHPNAVPVETLEQVPEVDYAVSGEGERAIVELCEAVGDAPTRDIADVVNLFWRDGERVRSNRKWTADDLDSLECAWSHMAPGSYPLLAHGILNRAWPVAPIFATRGCPYPCTFCSAADNMGKQIRVRSPEHVVDEIQLLVERYGVKEIHIEDDNFTFNRRFAMAVCREIIDRRIDVHWTCPNGVRLDRLDAELLVAMERAGCYSFAVGIETGSDAMLKKMVKKATVDSNMRQLELIRRHTDIRITGFFIMGHPGETEADIDATERFAMEAPLDRISISPFMPLPNTASFFQAVSDGKLDLKPDWGAVSAYSDETYQSYSEVPTDVLMRRIREISLKFWMRPRILWGVMREIHSLDQLKVSMDYVLYLSGLKKVRYW